MRRLFYPVILVLSILSQGCTLICDGVRVTCTCVEDKVEDVLEYRRDRQLANEVWGSVCSCKPAHTYSNDYVLGFKDGFVDYLYRGGNGEPPPLAPAKYRKFRYQTPQGYLAIEDWFAGYRHGAVAAKETNYRRWITGPAASGFAAGDCFSGEGHPGAPSPYPMLSSKGPESTTQRAGTTKMGAPVPLDGASKLADGPRARLEGPEQSSTYPRTGLDFRPGEP